MRQLARQPDLPRLGAGIGLNASQADPKPRTRRDVDNPPKVLRLHLRGQCLRHKEGPRQVDIENTLPVALRYLFQRPSRLMQDPAGIVHKNIIGLP